MPLTITKYISKEQWLNLTARIRNPRIAMNLGARLGIVETCCTAETGVTSNSSIAFSSGFGLSTTPPETITSNFFISNSGAEATNAELRFHIDVGDNVAVGTVVLGALPAGWTLISSDANGWTIGTTNALLPGLLNGVTIPMSFNSLTVGNSINIITPIAGYGLNVTSGTGVINWTVI